MAAYEARLRSIKTMGLVGGGMVGAGIFGLELLKKPLQEAAKFQTDVAKFSALGLGDIATRDAVKFAKSMDVMGNSARDNMILIRDATTIMGNLEHAKEAAPLLAKMRFGIEAVMGEGKGMGFEAALQASLKVAELRGALIDKKTGEIDVAKFGQSLNFMAQAYVASGGRVKPQDYLALMKTGGVSAKMAGDEAFYFGLGHVLQESGGSRTGTALMSMFQNWAMGRMPQGIAERMAKQGFLEPSAIHYGKTGHVTSVDPGALKDVAAFTDNAIQYVNKEIIPQLKAQGLSGAELNFRLASYLGIRTASNLADTFFREAKVIELYSERAKKAANVEGLYKIAGSTYQGKERDLTAKWSSLMVELGEVALPPAIKGTELLINGIKTMTAFTKESPGLTKLVVEAGAATAVLTTVGGTLLITTAGFKALGLAMQFGAIGGAPGLANTATQIGAVGGSLRFLAGAVGTLAAAAAAYQAGHYLGTKIYEEGADDPVMRWFGKGIAHTTALFGDKDAQEAIASERRFELGKGNLAASKPHSDLSFLTPLVARAQEIAAARPAVFAATPGRLGTSFLAPLSIKAPTLPLASLLAPPSNPKAAALASAPVSSLTFLSAFAAKAAITPVANPTTQIAPSFMTAKPAADTRPREIVVKLDGRVLARAMDDQFGRGSGALQGTTQFDPNLSMPPIALPQTK